MTNSAALAVIVTVWPPLADTWSSLASPHQPCFTSRRVMRWMLTLSPWCLVSLRATQCAPSHSCLSICQWCYLECHTDSPLSSIHLWPIVYWSDKMMGEKLISSVECFSWNVQHKFKPDHYLSQKDSCTGISAMPFCLLTSWWHVSWFGVCTLLLVLKKGPQDYRLHCEQRASGVSQHPYF